MVTNRELFNRKWVPPVIVLVIGALLVWFLTRNSPKAVASVLTPALPVG